MAQALEHPTLTPAGPYHRIALRSRSLAWAMAFCASAVLAQVPAAEPLSLAAIGALSGRPMTRDEVVLLVVGSKAGMIEFGGGERFWTHQPDGTGSANQIGTGAGFNPHWKTGRSKWVVNDDGIYTVDLDFGHMMVFTYHFQFFTANGQVLVHLEPPRPGAKVTIQR